MSEPVTHTTGSALASRVSLPWGLTTSAPAVARFAEHEGIDLVAQFADVKRGRC
jgi:hypothetical protein